MCKVPHKHAALIKAWADGAEIEVQRINSNVWEIAHCPAWVEQATYRIKPEPKPDVVITRYIYKIHIVDIKQNSVCYPNVKFTFDGETGNLKAVELIN